MITWPYSIRNVKDREKKYFGAPWKLVATRHHKLSTSCHENLS